LLSFGHSFALYSAAYTAAYDIGIISVLLADNFITVLHFAVYCRCCC